MVFNKIKHYRRRIEELEIENSQLRAELKGLEESGYAGLVRKTKESAEKYNDLMKEARQLRNEYECMVKSQKEIVKEYKESANKA